MFQQSCGYYVHAVLSVLCVSGVWTAFWAMHFNVKWPEDGEIDIMKTWNGKGTNGSCPHWEHYNGADSKKHRVKCTTIPDMDKPHDYSFSWNEEGQCTWQVYNQVNTSIFGYLHAARAGFLTVDLSCVPGHRRQSDHSQNFKYIFMFPSCSRIHHLTMQVKLNVIMGGNVTGNRTPADEEYRTTIHSVEMNDAVRARRNNIPQS
jgi:hypothetical protein